MKTDAAAVIIIVVVLPFIPTTNAGRGITLGGRKRGNTTIEGIPVQTRFIDGRQLARVVMIRRQVDVSRMAPNETAQELAEEGRIPGETSRTSDSRSE